MRPSPIHDCCAVFLLWHTPQRSKCPPHTHTTEHRNYEHEFPKPLPPQSAPIFDRAINLSCCSRSHCGQPSASTHGRKEAHAGRSSAQLESWCCSNCFVVAIWSRRHNILQKHQHERRTALWIFGDLIVGPHWFHSPPRSLHRNSRGTHCWRSLLRASL